MIRDSRQSLSLLICAMLLVSLLSGCAITGSDPAATPAAPSEPAVQPTTQPVTEPEIPEVSTEPVPPVSATATITVTGDLLMHIPVINSCKVSGGWDFTPVFRYAEPYIQSADYAVVNLETTLCGTGNGYPYSGYPRFNCPDALAEGARDVGFDMLLTANNHCYDTNVVGLRRTVETVRSFGLTALGTTATTEEPKFTVVDLNGIDVGMICYTYESPDPDPDRISVNGLPLSDKALGLINTFDYEHLDAFYRELSAHMAAMTAQGADAFVLYIHWGDEYALSPNQNQQEMAQKLCDLGVDVIVGGHPHVIQPVQLLTATGNDARKTLCIYSTGNALSNQRQGKIASCPTAHTEDGVLFSFTFAKYSDGTVAVQSTQAIPIWLQKTSSPRAFIMLPLDSEKVDSWKELFSLSSGGLTACQASYERTMALIGPGMEQAQAYFEATDTAKQAALTNPRETAGCP